MPFHVATKRTRTSSSFSFISALRNLFFVALLFLLPASASAQLITDPSLDAAIRVAISKTNGAITSTNLLSLSTLNAGARGITNLTGINGALNLTSFDLGDNSISDISLLSPLTNLATLRIKDNPITSLQALSTLPNLAWLDVSADPITGLSPLTSLSHLQTLVANNCGFTSATPLKTLTPLRTLFLQNNVIADLTDIKSLTNLTSLYLPGNQITSIAPLTNLSALTLLQLDQNQCADTTFLSRLTNLTSISLAANGLTQFQLAPPVITQGPVAFSDDFTRGTDPAPITPWQIPSTLSGAWFISGGGMQSGTNILQSYSFTYVTNTFSDSTMSAQVKFSSLAAWGGGIGGRLNPNTGAHYAAWVYPENSPGGGNAIRLIKFSNWTSFGYRGTNFGFMAETNLTGVGTGFHTVTLSFFGNQINVSLDGVQLLSTTDVEAQTYSTGSPCLDMWTDLVFYNMSVDNLQVSSLSMLPTLSKVSFLNLSGNAFTNVSSIGLLPGLTQLNLYSNKVTDISALHYLSALGNANLSYNNISDVSSLSGLTNLKALHLSANAISNASPLSGLVNLYVLNANENALTNLAFVSGMTQLQRLSCFGNTISDITGIQNLSQLTTLDLRNNHIADCSLIVGFTNLSTLNLSWNSFSNINTFVTLPLLRTLDVSYSQITNINALATLTQLSSLNLGGTPINDLSPLTNSSRLTQLDISRTQVTNFATVQSLSGLTALMVDGLTNQSFPNLSNLTKLVFFSAEQGSFTNISFLSQNTNLNFLQLTGNSLTNLTPLTPLTNLIYAYLSDNGLTNISALLALPHLAGVDLHNNYLDLSSNSTASTVIQTLLQKGVAVNYQPQLPPPAISAITAQSIGINGASTNILFTNSQPATVTLHSSKQSLIPDTNLVVYGYAGTNHLVITPLANTTGSATVTITATNPKGLSAVVTFTVNIVNSPAVNLSDSSLDYAIRLQLDRFAGTLSQIDLSRLTSFSAVNSLIFSVSGLQMATNLHVLNLNNQPITDLSPLAGLTNLQSLSASGVGINDISFLSPLTRLTNLDISFNYLQDCSSLSGLFTLQTLSLNDNFFGNLSCLGALTNLSVLTAEQCQLTNCAFAAALNHLSLLDLNENFVADISPVSGLTNLSELDLSLNLITNLSPLTNLTLLHTLLLSHESAVSFSALSGLTNLSTLQLARNNLSNLNFVPPMLLLGTLDVSDNNLTNISALGNLPLLTNLDADGNLLTDITPLTNDLALTRVSLMQNQLQSLAPSLQLPQLSFLDVRLNGLNLNSAPVLSVLTTLQQSGVTVLTDQTNAQPWLQAIGNQLIPPNTAITPIYLKFADIDSDPCTLTVTVKSSNQALFPDSSLHLNGFCDNLTLTATPTTNLTGAANITITVTDILGASYTRVFGIEVLVNALVTFSDTSLQTIVQSNIQKQASLTLYDMRGLTFLYASGSGITNLTGLQPAINLIYADLSYNLFTDASPLSNLTNLQTIILDGNKINSLAFANPLNYLAVGSFQNTGIVDISPLANKTNFTYLDLSYNLVPNLLPIKNLHNLSALILDGTGLQDISFLSSLSSLQYLSLANNNIKDLSPLLNFPYLVFVDIYGNNLDLSPGTTNAAVIAHLQNQGVFIPTLTQVSQPYIVSGSSIASLNAGMQLTFSGVPGRTYNVQASTNMVTWITLTNIPSLSRTTKFSDPDYSHFSQRFYRIQAGPLIPSVTLGLPVRNANGTYSLNIFGTGARAFILQSSTNLSTWTVVSTNTSINGNLLVPGVTNLSARQFYRLLLP